MLLREPNAVHMKRLLITLFIVLIYNHWAWDSILVQTDILRRAPCPILGPFIGAAHPAAPRPSRDVFFYLWRSAFKNIKERRQRPLYIKINRASLRNNMAAQVIDDHRGEEIMKNMWGKDLNKCGHGEYSSREWEEWVAP